MGKKLVLSAVCWVAVAALLAWGQGAPTIDGTIGTDEYKFSFNFEQIGMDVHWTMTETELYVGISAPATGWVAFGVRDGVPEESAENVMEGVDFYIGYLQDGELFMRDDFANTPFTHVADTELGGNDDVIEAAGSEADGVTTIEFKRAIDTSDDFDNPIAQGEAEVYLAYSNADDFISIHTERLEAVINFLTGEVSFETEEE